MLRLFLYIIFITNISIASAPTPLAPENQISRTITDQISNEYGNCYRNFDSNLSDCTPSTCNYADLSDAKAWKAQIIRGLVNDKCYVIYYSYIGSQIINEPQHCFYTKDQLGALANAYSNLFRTDSAIQITDLKDKINQLTYVNCKQANKNNKEAAK